MEVGRGRRHCWGRWGMALNRGKACTVHCPAAKKKMKMDLEASTEVVEPDRKSKR